MLEGSSTTGASGATVSMVNGTAAEAGLTFPEPSVARAVTEWFHWASAVVAEKVQLQAPSDVTAPA